MPSNLLFNSLFQRLLSMIPLILRIESGFESLNFLRIFWLFNGFVFSFWELEGFVPWSCVIPFLFLVELILGFFSVGTSALFVY